MVEVFEPEHLSEYGTVCGWALARAHARSGDAAMISGYLGSGPNFDEAIADFAVAYADQSERDHDALAAAVRAGKVEAVSDPSLATQTSEVFKDFRKSSSNGNIIEFKP